MQLSGVYVYPVNVVMCLYLKCYLLYIFNALTSYETLLISV